MSHTDCISRDVVVHLASLALEMGHIIRLLDESCEWNWYWTLDGTEEGPLYIQDSRYIDFLPLPIQEEAAAAAGLDLDSLLRTHSRRKEEE